MYMSIVQVKLSYSDGCCKVKRKHLRSHIASYYMFGQNFLSIKYEHASCKVCVKWTYASCCL